LSAAGHLQVRHPGSAWCRIVKLRPDGPALEPSRTVDAGGTGVHHGGVFWSAVRRGSRSAYFVERINLNLKLRDRHACLRGGFNRTAASMAAVVTATGIQFADRVFQVGLQLLQRGPAAGGILSSLG
jgi:hypothetical protein